MGQATGDNGSGFANQPLPCNWTSSDAGDNQTFQIVAQEQVKARAGTFQAFKVVLTLKGEFGAKGTSQPINYRITQWYAKGVGLVRQEDQNAVHELINYTP